MLDYLLRHRLRRDGQRPAYQPGLAAARPRSAIIRSECALRWRVEAGLATIVVSLNASLRRSQQRGPRTTLFAGHVSTFDWAYRRLFCWPSRSVGGSRMPRQYCQNAQAHNSPVGVTVPAAAVTKMPRRQSAFPDGGCYFVAVTAWMMTAYRRCQCGECTPAAASR